MPDQPSDIEIAQSAKVAPIRQIAERIGLSSQDLIPYGHDKAKISATALQALSARSDGKLILVTAINPTPAGEGKTTTTVGLGDGLRHIGKNAMICIREASLGPCFGVKGGAAGGGYAQVVPMESMNLHFTGDIHAIGAAHNLLAAIVDNHIHWGNTLGIDPRRVSWPRVVDMNDRALRDMVVSLGGPANGMPRESRFDITVASEVMAILCLASDLDDLQERLAKIIVARTFDGAPVTARDLNADGAMTVLLKDALLPNLVQSLEGTPAFVHGGPFANIAHGCNSVMATRAALKLADYVVTEAGFGAELGAEKFFNIKCRKAGLAPSAAVLVTTVRALKVNGGASLFELGEENPQALDAGLANLARHMDNIAKFSVPVVVAINHFAGDRGIELARVMEFVEARGQRAIVCRHWAEGGAGASQLAEAVVETLEQETADFTPLYGDDLPLTEKIERVARDIYGAGEVVFDAAALKRLETWQGEGHGRLPVCIAKTPYSFTANPSERGAPKGFTLPVRDVRLSAGAGFVVALTGDVMTMPGLPRQPAAETIGIDPDGQIKGLF
ncbi:MAG: formate--tetrahydrofolate ligase [Pseudomonadota bacterium]